MAGSYSSSTGHHFCSNDDLARLRVKLLPFNISNIHIYHETKQLNDITQSLEALHAFESGDDALIYPHVQ